MTVKRPILRYYGGKWRVAPKIIKWFPDHIVYVEPFGGGASVLLRKEPAKIEVYNDIDSNVVNLFRVMRERAGDLLFKLYYTPNSRDEYEQCMEYDGDDPVEWARTFFVVCWQGYLPAGLERTSVWKVCVDTPQLSIDNLMNIIDRMRDVYIEAMDFRRLIERYDGIDTLFYIDPPYLREGQGFAYPLVEQDHIDLADLLNNMDGYAIISATDSKLYRRLYENWIWEPLSISTMQKNRKVEYLIMNYEFEYET